MRLGSNQRTPTELKDQLLQARRAYHDGKQKLVEQSVTSLEAKTKPLFGVLFLGLTMSVWLVAVLSPAGFEKLYEAFSLYPIAVLFAISYFTFYLGSKLILRPSAEELADDTSYFSLFSACGRKEMRSWISIGFGLFHTLIFFLYLINKDTNWLGSLQI